MSRTNLKTIDLTGQWQFTEYPAKARRMRDVEDSNWRQCTVPNSIFTNLIESHQIEEADLLANPENYKDISRKAWLYQKNFDCPQEILDSDRCDLVFDGLDTVTQIWLNGKLIAKTNNMFVSHRIDVSRHLKAGSNHLMVKFESPLACAEKLADRYGQITSDANGHGSRVYIRKAQYQFGWDWGPPLPGCGIFRPLRIEAIDKARIENIHIRTVNCTENFADIRISAQLDRATSGKYRLETKIISPDGSPAGFLAMDFERRDDYLSGMIRIDQPGLWFPVGYGSQPLYKVNAKLICDENTVDCKSEAFGIRTVKVNQNKDTFGKSFTFEINNQFVYCKGANWIPISMLAGSAKYENYEKLLTAAAEANMNMLRVWGGGYYEDPAFYEICDRLGIMLWQDFMFACGYYPDRGWFAKEVKDEVEQAIKRLRNHPSIVIWCGNNENHWLHKCGWQGQKKKFYGKHIYNNLIPHILSELDPDRDYVNSSPFGDAKNPNSPSNGTTHNWQVWSGMAGSNDYLADNKNIPRFVCEFGFQSMPGKNTIKTFGPSEQICLGSAAVEKHNYQLAGNERLGFYIAENFPSPKSMNDYAFLSQLTQARAVVKYIEHLRANSEINSGVLYWQLNDAFPSTSWSSIDYMGVPKGLYYYAKRAFAPVTICPSLTFTPPTQGIWNKLASLSAAVSNQSPLTFTAMLICQLKDLDFNIIDEFKRPVSVAPGRSLKTNLPESFISPINPEKSFVHFQLDDAGNKKIENSYFYLPDKYIEWKNQPPEITAEKIQAHKWQLNLMSKTVIRDLSIDMKTLATLTDNFLNLTTAENRTITVTTASEIEDLLSEIQIKSVNSTLT
ncbi:MAG: hypothetical protein K8R02_08895 [Anaerohalosphaeraceae bacterium]|nr:hypothetical protein [Anaerohalosphaeraceae bacterium]